MDDGGELSATRRRSAAVGAVVIRRPVGEVYAYYSDLRHLPEFLGDVLAVEPCGPGGYRWTVALPLGVRMHWNTRTTVAETDRRFAYETRTLGLVTRWDLRFTATSVGATRVEETLSMPGGRLGLVVLALVGKHPRLEVQANLHRLQQRLEDGRVTDDSSTMGKHFDG